MKSQLLKGTLGLALVIQGPPQASAAQATPAETFRGIFSAAAAETGLDANAINHLIYAPAAKLFNEQGFYADRCSVTSAKNPQETTARGMLCKMHDVYNTESAQDLFNRGTQAKTVPADLVELTKKLDSKDLLIVVVPGIFGEFIQKRAFEEVFPVAKSDGTFDNDSAFAREWRAALESKTTSEVYDRECAKVDDPSSVCDEQEQLSRLSPRKGDRGARNISMGQLMNVGSIDDSSGKPSVRVALFQMDPMTLESLGKQEVNARIFNRRLEKFFKILGHTPSSIAFVGYSRGTAYALEMLSQAKNENKPWLQNVKALVSLGGVVFGSALADDVILNKTSPVHQQVHYVNVLRDTLTMLPEAGEPPYGAKNSKWLAYNTLAWWKFITAMARIQSGDTSDAQSSKITAESISRDTGKVIAWLKRTVENRGVTDPVFAASMIMTESVKFGLVSENIDQDVQQLAQALQSLVTGDTQPVAQFLRSHMPQVSNENPNPYTTTYNSHIRRFKKLAAAALQGVKELTTDSRLEWWRTHALPLHVRYYSISGTMAPEENALATNRFAYNPGSPDDLSLTKNWKDLTAVQVGPEYDGVALNDSQVAIYKTVFWPRLISSLNPANEGLRASSLGIVGTHHWGMALPIVVQVRKMFTSVDGPGFMMKNPFPRAVLMKSLALMIASDLSENESAKGVQK